MRDAEHVPRIIATPAGSLLVRSGSVFGSLLSERAGSVNRPLLANADPHALCSARFLVLWQLELAAVQRLAGHSASERAINRLRSRPNSPRNTLRWAQCEMFTKRPRPVQIFLRCPSQNLAGRERDDRPDIFVQNH